MPAPVIDALGVAVSAQLERDQRALRGLGRARRGEARLCRWLGWIPGVEAASRRRLIEVDRVEAGLRAAEAGLRQSVAGQGPT